ncbi:MAG: endonuclease domain-containing protein [Eubacterium sp.]
MKPTYNSRYKEKAQDLRKNATREEQHLWYDFLKKYPVPFKRQKIVDHYILDFYCAQAHLAIELDGSGHFDDAAIEYDLKRTAYLKTLGIKVLRFINSDIKNNFEGVCFCIDKSVNEQLQT